MLPYPHTQKKRMYTLDYDMVTEKKEYLYEESNLNKSIDYWTMVEKSRNNGRSILEEIHKSKQQIMVRLGADPILTRPWNIGRLIGAFLNIGEGKESGDWIQDPNNHRVELWLPFGVTFVSSGNHSITTGILNNEGQLNVDNVYKMDFEVLNSIQCDGVHYFRKKDGSLIAPVNNLSLAAVFEIGKLIIRHWDNPVYFKGLKM
ncbi:DUF6710 family protein [Paenibacillus polymyxa]|uniref:DUF6710 family protein n=1 Tax=Paenibacillus polymyxa TaxID=1406 RepID=UPI0036F43902